MKSFYVGVKAIIEHANKILLLKSSLENSYYWDLPGGRIEGNEGFEEALGRELNEELGYEGELLVQKVIHVYRLANNVEGEQGLVLIFFKVSADISEIRLSGEHSEYLWIEKKDIIDFLQREMKGEGIKEAISLYVQQSN